ncbi:hypothetical protein J2X12_004115 [Pseudarthrobacter oxydans]|uniref:Uncharacterized protein n=1 Tax=Pseudarthrobacter oxydans TaxID=1671 RepID=A0AAW8NGQ2_PSEOX|nr:hypothetical protein [Pseudarthrobacter oxydans]MDR6794737.1 hypothetical protein [Pseudarthrobacter oxydans]MDR7166061.1 hypothetical protein [Pseudarthrobacter oxydans]
MAKKQADTKANGEVGETAMNTSHLYFVPNVGEVEAESLDDVEKKLNKEEVGDGDS